MTSLYLMIRVGSALALCVAGITLWLLWGTIGAVVVALLALLTAVDGIVRLRTDRSTELWGVMLIDITVAGVAVVLSGLPDVIAILPYTYAVIAAALLLNPRRARLTMLYTGAWLVAIVFVDRLPYTVEPTERQAIIVGGIGLAVFLTNTVVLTSVAARGLRSRERVQEELRATDQHLHAVVTSAPVVLFALDAAGRITLSEGAGLRVLGFEPGQAVGKSAFELYDGEPQIAALLAAGLERDGPTSGLIRYQGFEFDVRILPRFDGDGNRAGLIGTATDVSAQRAAQRELEERGDLEHLIATLSTTLITVPLDDVDEAVNTALGEIAGFAGVDRAYVLLASLAEDVWTESHEWHKPGLEPHMPYYEKISPEDYPWMSERLAAGRIISVPTRADLPAEAWALKREMIDRGLESMCLVPLAVSGEVTGLVGFASAQAMSMRRYDLMLLRVVGEMILAVLERRHSHLQLEQLVASKDDFVAAVSHELRTPLTTVVGLAEELRESAASFSPEEIEQLHDLIAEQSADVAGIVEDLLVAARADMGRVAITPEELDISAEIELTVAAVSHADRQRIAVEPSEHDVYADRIRVRQVLRNLVTNALRYGGDRIVLGCESRNGHVIVEVRDDGPGIAPSDVERIFEPYHHTQQVAGRPSSIGLGLTVARQLAELMGGELGYERRDEWSVFNFSLPRRVG